MAPYRLYLLLRFSFAVLFSMIVTVNLVYHVLVVKLLPLQLVLIGTILESSVLLFEIPTGVLADLKSRKLSIIIGYLMMGSGFILEGSIPQLWAVALAQVVWGCGFTFTSGATEAWIADEIGPEAAGNAYIRGAQLERVGTLAAIPVSVWIGTSRVALPIVLGGWLFIGLAVLLVLVMTEHGFQPTAATGRSTWRSLTRTIAGAHRLTRKQPVLLVLLAIALFSGLYSEGFDRLWTPYLLHSFSLPLADRVVPVVWFGAIRAVHLVLGIAAIELVRRRLDTQQASHLGRACQLCTGLVVLALAGFGAAPLIWIAIALYWLIETSRSVMAPLHTAWLNQRIDDPQVRATMFSAQSLVDALGQVGGGPVLGAIGNTSLRLALLASALVLSPALLLYRLALRRSPGSRKRASSL
jgi:DHA3 family tetracycline resistance protein-like MFS transporter